MKTKSIAVFDEQFGDYKIYAVKICAVPDEPKEPKPLPEGCVETKYRASGEFTTDGSGNKAEIYKAVAVLNQYQEERIASQIDGYFRVSPADPNRKTIGKAFVAAKTELIHALEQELANVRRMEFDRWQEKTNLHYAKNGI